MNPALTHLRRGYKRLVARPRSWWALRQAVASGDPPARALAASLRATVGHCTAPREGAVIDRIEARRRDLCASDTPVSYCDPGAGSALVPGTSRAETIGAVASRASQPPDYGLLLFRIVRELRPQTCLELGTCLGISGAYQAAALQLNERGRLITIEGVEPFARVAEEGFETLGLADRVTILVGGFAERMGDALGPEADVDYAFIDGHHDRDATVAYFDQVAARASARSALVFDDVTWSEGMREAWHHIASDPRVGVVANVGKMGVCLLGLPPSGSRLEFTVAL